MRIKKVSFSGDWESSYPDSHSYQYSSVFYRPPSVTSNPNVCDTFELQEPITKKPLVKNTALVKPEKGILGKIISRLLKK